MGGGEAGAMARELDQTATWAVAAVCGVIILVSYLLEMGLHHFGEVPNFANSLRYLCFVGVKILKEI